MPALTWLVCAAVIVAMLVRPRGIPEWVWALGGATVLVAFRLVAWRAAVGALRRAVDVELFLVGMMVLAEVARAEGIFDALAAWALRAAHGSQERLFVLLYAVGVIVTAFLSNDATAVALTPAVAAIAARAAVAPLPYAYACAFVANAASFMLPISNPANLVMYAERLPALAAWLRAYALPSFVAVVATYLLLRFLGRAALRRPMGRLDEIHVALGRRGIVAAVSLCIAVAGMVLANALGAWLGVTTFLLACLVLAAVVAVDRRAITVVPRGVMWSIVPLVAGLFVVVQALDEAGALTAARGFLVYASGLPHPNGVLLTAAAVTLAANVANNLPVAVVAGLSLHGHAVSPPILHAGVVSVDLGPNLSTSGSLATLLWMATLRREGIAMTPRRFLRVGALVLIPTLVLVALVVQ